MFQVLHISNSIVAGFVIETKYHPKPLVIQFWYSSSYKYSTYYSKKVCNLNNQST